MTINRDEAIADLQATVDYLGSLTNEADTLGFEAATDIRDEAKRVVKAAGDLVSFLEGKMLTELEAGSREYGGRVWVRKRKYVERHDHSVIARVARDAAIAAARDEETGEVNSALALNAAIETMRQVYLSPSTKAKVTVVRDQLGVPTKNFVTREDKGWELDIVDLRDQDEDE